MSNLKNRPHNLPNPTTPFIGRADELAQLTKLLTPSDPQGFTAAQPWGLSTRLLTILGPGGIGKTRLALELARDLTSAQCGDLYRDGVFFVSLAPLTSPISIAPAIAEAIGFQFYMGGAPQQQLLGYLREKRMLIVLDNCEHLLSGVEGSDGIGLVSDILRTAPHVQIIATSRERLQLQQEHSFTVQGLDFPMWETPADALQYDAVQLFIQNARRVQPAFTLKQADLIYLARICRLAQGMPLGLELAAAWVELLSLKEVADELMRSADVLATQLRNVPERQRSIRATFNYSWNLLAEPERVVFKQLAVFRGGFTREAAQVIVGASLHALATLVNKSLVYRVQPQTSDATNNGRAAEASAPARYEIHELLRQYAEEQLKTREVSENLAGLTAAKHSAYYIAWMREREAALKDRRQETMLEAMDVEVENVRAAWMYAVAQGQHEQLAQVMDVVGLYYERRGRLVEGEQLCAVVVDATPNVTLAHAKAWAWRGAFEFMLGHTREGQAYLQQSVQRLQQLNSEDWQILKAQAFALWRLGWVKIFIGEPQEARQCSEASLVAYRQTGDSWAIANVLDDISNLSWLDGDYVDANNRVEEALALRRLQGDSYGTSTSLVGLCAIAVSKGQFSDVEQWASEALCLARTAASKEHLAWVLSQLAMIQVRLGQFAKGLALYQESLALVRHLGLSQQVTDLATSLPLYYLISGDYSCARELAQQGIKLSSESGYRRGMALSLSFLGLAELCLGEYAPAQQHFQQSISLYRCLNQSEELACALTGLATTKRALQDRHDMRQLGCEALQLSIHTHSAFSMLQALTLFVLWLVDEEQTEYAVELCSLLRRYPYFQMRLFDDLYGRTVDAAAETLSSEVARAARVRGAQLDLQATAEALLVEFQTETASAPAKPQPAATRHSRMPKRKLNGLTSREREVACLIGQGLSNREIAEQLTLSERTIEAHISHIFTKLDFTTRIQIRKWAKENV
jgi:predicted ATPase/DNA-binding CsgD family transcriptional regulator